MTTYRKAFQCAKDGTCPERNDEAGCHLWWEWASINGNIVKGCVLSQNILFPLLTAVAHEAGCAASSADKAANVSCETLIAAERGNKATVGAMSLMLCLASGQITSLKAIEASHDEEIQCRIGKVD